MIYRNMVPTLRWSCWFIYFIRRRKLKIWRFTDLTILDETQLSWCFDYLFGTHGTAYKTETFPNDRDFTQPGHIFKNIYLLFFHGTKMTLDPKHDNWSILIRYMRKNCYLADDYSRKLRIPFRQQSYINHMNKPINDKDHISPLIIWSKIILHSQHLKLFTVRLCFMTRLQPMTTQTLWKRSATL